MGTLKAVRSLFGQQLIAFLEISSVKEEARAQQVQVRHHPGFRLLLGIFIAPGYRIAMGNAIEHMPFVACFIAIDQGLPAEFLVGLLDEVPPVVGAQIGFKVGGGISVQPAQLGQPEHVVQIRETEVSAALRIQL